MVKVVTSSQMYRIDDRTIKEFGIPGFVLMERAGLAVAKRVRDLFEKRRVTVLSGGGNNGGDGIVAARNLMNWGWNVRVLLMLREDRLSPDCLAQYRIAKQMGVPLEFRASVDERDMHGAVVIDALLGTGINKPVTSPMSEVISFLNRSSAPVVSVDIPTGISSDTGQVYGEAVEADYTITFGLPKIGHILHPGARYTGRLFVEDIGFPKELLETEDISAELVERGDVEALLPRRRPDSHKGTYGHVLVVAGSRGKTGAAIMAARACLRSGAGAVTIGVPASLTDVFLARVTEEMVLPLPDAGDGTLSEKALDLILEFSREKMRVIAIGPGMTAGPAIRTLMRELVPRSPAPLVLDADAINALAGRKEILREAVVPVILTPHIAEMARLIAKLPEEKGRKGERDISGEKAESLYAKAREEISQDLVSAASSLSRETGTYLILKGAPTIIAEPEGGVLLNSTGNPGMATAGSGDVLTGVVAAFVAQGLRPVAAAAAGVYLHGSAGDLAAGKKGEHSLIATDIIEHLPSAFLAVRRP